MDDYKITTNDKRQMNMMSLDTFTFDINNNIDYSLKELIGNLKDRIQQNFREHDKWVEMEEKTPQKFKELEEVANQTGHSLYFQMQDYIYDNIYLEDELFALYQVKIIYAFSHFEINLKRLLSSTYDDKTINKKSDWNSFIQYFSFKNINIKCIEGYKEVDQLRQVNNSLKHASGYDKSLNHIDEFKNIERITYAELEKFYNRVEKFSNIFLRKIISEIHIDMYEFNDEKLKSIAESLALRMDNNTVEIFIEELKKHYK